MKRIFFLITMVLLIHAQAICQVPGIRLINAKVKSVSKDTTSIGSFVFEADKYLVKAKTITTLRTHMIPEYAKRKRVTTKLAIYHLPDSNCILRDSIYAHIADYWDEQERWYRESLSSKSDSSIERLRGDFKSLPTAESFYTCGTDTVPVISPKHGRTGTYVILYFKEQFYKIVLLESKGMGGIGFVGQNMILTYDGTDYPCSGYTTNWMDEIRQILEKKKDCAYNTEDRTFK